MSMLRRLSRAAIRYGLKPEEIGPISTFTDEHYMAKYLAHMQGWEAPSFYGCTDKHRYRARNAWARTIAKVEADATKKGSNKSARAPDPAPQKKARRRANVPQTRPVVDEQEPEDGFDMAILAPAETGMPLFIYILQDLGLITEIHVEVAHSAKGSRSETVKVAIRPTVHVTSGHLDVHELELLTRWIDLNRNVLVKYWEGEIESTMDAIRALQPIEKP